MSKSKTRSEKLQGAVKVAEKAKQEAVKQATQPLGLCLIIAVFMLVLVIAPPLVIVLV